jgi:hypothetical protein
MSGNAFLRTTLLVDSLASTGSTLLLLFFARRLSLLSGLPQSMLLLVGVALIPWCLLVGWAASLKRTPGNLVWSIIALNGLWVLGSILLLTLGAPTATTLGSGLVVLQAVVVCGFMTAQYVGLTRAVAKA